MSLLLLHHRHGGLVRSGLMAYYNFSKRNLLTYSEQFDNSVWGFGTVLANQALSPRGDLTADDVVDDLTTTASIFLQTVTVESSSKTYTFSVFVKKDQDESRFPEFRIKLAGGSNQPTTAGHLNSKTGQAVLRVGDGTVTVSDEGDYWRVAVSQADTASGNTEVRCSILPAYTDTLGAGSVATLTGSIVAWGAQLNEGVAALPYEPTTDNQQLPDVSGRGNHGELGSTSVADTNDPEWVNYRLRFSGIDDYVSTPDAVTADATELTAQIVFRKNIGSAAGANRALLGHDLLGSFIRFESDTTAGFTLTGSVLETALVGAPGSVPDDGQWKVITCRWKSGVVQDQILNSGNRIAFDETNPADGSHARTLKQIGAYNGADYFSGEIASVLHYRRFLTDSEVIQNYRFLKGVEASRGVSLP